MLIHTSFNSDELLEMIRIDAMVMSLLSTSKRILNLYGHCGASVSVATMDGPSLPSLIEDQSALTAEVKLYIALSMAMSLADLHGHKGGPIVHADVQYLQWLFDENNNVVLVDFNRAEPMLWDEESGTYCEYFVGGALGIVRSPEEYLYEIVDEKIDVYSFGIVLFTLLTGKEPYQDDDNFDIREAMKAGSKPIVDTEIRNRSDIETIMSTVMDKCLEFDASERIDIFTVVSLLEEFFASKFGPLESVTVEDLGFKDEYYYTYDDEENSITTDFREELRR